jgi:Trypsin-like peptidase domain
MSAWPDTTIEAEELCRYVVRVESEAGRILGTGFFVAPSWVLTCAHVVGEAKKVKVVPDRSICPATLSASIDAASPSPSHSSGLWPFPDLALLHLDERLNHPCALLDVEGPVAGGEWLAWGYSQREHGIPPQGSSASFRLEGPEGDGYLKLKGGEAALGLSGAPLVCPRRRAVVGVVVASRQLRSDLGGYATPVASLLCSTKGMPADIAAHGALVRAMNVRAVIDGGRAWHRVLNDGSLSGILDRPWTPFVKGDASSPTDLLRPEFGVVPYLFRQVALQEAMAWCNQDKPFAIARVLGDIGSGKTRFALELCRMLCEQGWLAGIWRRGKPSATIVRPRLIVVDFAEADELSLALEAINDLISSASEIAPVRVLLLTRTGADRQLPGPVREEAPAPLINILASDLIIDGVSTALDITQRETLYAEAVRAFANAWYPALPAEARFNEQRQHRPNLSDRRYAAPLEVLFEALDQALGGQSAYRQSLSPVERILERERRYWRKSGSQLDPKMLESVAALATLAGAATDEEARTLLEILPALRGSGANDERRRLIDWYRGLYGGPGLLNPVRPDRVGEALVSQFLHNQVDGGAELIRAALSLPSDYQVAQCLNVLANLMVVNPAEPKTRSAKTSSYESTKAALVRCSDDLKRRAVLPRDHAHLPNPVASAYDRLTEALRVAERLQDVQRQEAVAEDQVADERAREEETTREYTDFVERRNQLADVKSSQMPTIHALPAALDPETAREREHLSQRIEELVGELSVVRQARHLAESELNRLRSERGELDKLIVLKRQLEEQLKSQIRYVNEEQRRREEADEQRIQAEERGEITEQKLEVQFLRAEHEKAERERAERELREARDKLQDAQAKMEEIESTWHLLTLATRHQPDLSETIGLLHQKAWQTITELQQNLARLRHDQGRLVKKAIAVGAIAGAVLVSLLILIIL